MSDTARADTFAEALQRLDSSSSADTRLAQFAEGAELRQPELDAQGTTTEAEQFWSSYRNQFSEISTEFSSLHEADDIAVLEWTARATLAAGGSIEYAGVSLLTFDGDDLVSRFSTYHDNAAFVTPAS